MMMRLLLMLLFAGALPAGEVIRFGVCDWTLRKEGDNAAFALAARLGYAGVQVSLVPRGEGLNLDRPEARAACRAAADAAGVAITSLAIGRLNHVPLKSDPQAERWLAQGIAIARDMGLRTILVPCFVKGELRDDAAGVDAVVAALKRLAPAAEQAGVVLALESYLTAEEHLAIIARVGSPAVRVFYDVANARDAGHDVEREILLLKDRIVEFHAKDTKDIFGKGPTDFAAVRRAMEAFAYHGWFIVEGTVMSLGLEETLRHDGDHLRTVFK